MSLFRIHVSPHPDAPKPVPQNEPQSQQQNEPQTSPALRPLTIADVNGERYIYFTKLVRIPLKDILGVWHSNADHELAAVQTDRGILLVLDRYDDVCAAVYGKGVEK